VLDPAPVTASAGEHNKVLPNEQTIDNIAHGHLPNRSRHEDARPAAITSVPMLAHLDGPAKQMGCCSALVAEPLVKGVCV
jgi:hypothetical protein